MPGPPDDPGPVDPFVASLNGNEPQAESHPPRPQVDRRTPQENVNRFWKKFHAKHPGGVFHVLPENPYAQKKIPKTSKGVAQAQRAVRSYEQAREECLRDVDRIIRECRRVNQKYRDAHFDIESDLKKGRRECLEGLEKPRENYQPKSVKRVMDIFENPQFFVHGPSAGDVVQGFELGDCYLMAALCGLGGMSGLIDQVCVVQDQAVGVYGFVFHRDGEWQQCIIDDQLYLTAPDYDESDTERRVWDKIDRRDSEEEYRRTHQTGSRALYFAKCSDANETWLPLLEKAYAKAHGDYASISGGWTGEAIEDLTGGVTSEVHTADVLDKNALWTNELLKVGKDFLYGCSTGQYANWLEPNRLTTERQGILEGHAYSIIGAVEHTIDDQTYRLVKVRNPWGNTGWTGAWSDGSAEWTPQWMERLNHQFGNDGIFWMSFEDLLRKYQRLDRTRIFGPKWSVTQQWTSLHVPWSADYHQTRFSVNVTRTTPVVIVLSQLDERYFAGLEGQYSFKVQFRVQKVDNEEDYIVRSNLSYYTSRSVSTDISLEAGSYFVLMKITAAWQGGHPVDSLVAEHAAERPEKLIQVGLSYDVAHAKGVVVETEKEKEDREASAKARAAALREKWKNEAKSRSKKKWRKERRLARRYNGDEGHGGTNLGAAGTTDETRHEQNHDLPQPGREDSLIGGDPLVTGDGRYLTGEVIAAYEHPSATPTPMPWTTEHSAHSSPADGNHQTPWVGGSEDIAPDTEERGTEDAAPSIPKVQVNGVEPNSDAKPPKKRPAPLNNTAIMGNAFDKPQPLLEDDQKDVESPANNAPFTDTDSVDSFDWQTDLDYDSDDYADELARRDPSRDSHTADNKYDRHDDHDGEDDDGHQQQWPLDLEPWNAVCVVGLRVYSEDPNLSLQVVRPNPYAEEVKTGDGSGVGAEALDRDDPAKGAVAEQWAKTPLRDVFVSEANSAMLKFQPGKISTTTTTNTKC